MIYLDYQATTPLAPEAREAMLRWLGDDGDSFANPASTHKAGRAAAAAVEVARDQVAALLPPSSGWTRRSCRLTRRGWRCRPTRR